ncbi:MAG: hypothetical protein RJB66_1707 [Pseudomonadota bacterium]|jgi:glycosyltransferase involved in cell wall biosynthesis
MAEQQPLISVITPVYNAQDFLSATIESVLAQTYSHWELLLMMDAKSSDRSLLIAREWAARDQRIKVLESPEHQGVANNRNQGIAKASGAYMAFLDSDDLWRPEKLKKQLQFMQINQSTFSCHSYQQMSAAGQELQVIRRVPSQICYDDLLKENVIGCLTVMVESALLKRHPFKKDIPHEDFILWLDLLKEVPVAHGLDENLAQYRVLPQSRSGDKKRSALDRWHLYRHVLKLPLAKSLYCFAWYAFKALRVRL